MALRENRLHVLMTWSPATSRLGDDVVGHVTVAKASDGSQAPICVLNFALPTLPVVTAELSGKIDAFSRSVRSDRTERNGTERN